MRRFRGVSYDDLKTNNPICESYVSVMRAMGHHTVMNNAGQSGKLTGASTDMGTSARNLDIYLIDRSYLLTMVNIGNVSYAVPGFHGLFTIPTDGVNHTPGFTNGAGTPEAHQRCLACAAGMAVVACQIVTDDDFARRVKEDFEVEAEE